MGKQIIPEEAPEFRSAEEWAEQYQPVKKDIGIRDCLGGTLFDPFGEGRQYVGRMGEVFVWAVLNNGYFDYVQNGFSADALGYLVSDNPVRFTDAETKFVIGYEEIDWEVFARLRESGATAALDDNPEESTDGAADEPDAGADLDKPFPPEDAASISAAADGYAEPAPIDHAPVVEDATDAAPAEEVPDEIAEEARCAHGEALPDTGLAANIEEEPEQAVMAPPVAFAQELESPPTDTASVDAKNDFAEGVNPSEYKPDVYTEVSTAIEAQQIETDLSEDEPPGVTATSTSMESECPDEGQQPMAEDPDSGWVEEPPAKEPVGVRRLPIGSEDVQLDLEAYGAWPNAVACKACRGNGCFAGIEMCGIDCDGCDGRGWNPAPGAPREIPIYA